MEQPNSSQGRAAAARFDPKRLRPGDVYEAWRDFTYFLFDTTAVDTSRGFDAGAAMYEVEDVQLTRVRFDESYFHRHADRFPPGESEYISVQWYVRGSLRGVVGDHELYMGPDRIAIQDFSVPYDAVSQPSEVWGVNIPRARVPHAELLRTAAPIVAFPVASPAGRMLAGALGAVWDSLPHCTPEDHSGLAAGLVGLVNGLLFPTSRRLSEDDRLAAMKAYVRAHLGDPSLGVATLQHQFNYSRATVYRLFEREGGVARFIRSERLRACYDELAHPVRPGRVRVGEVAARWGFYDATQFTRAFRARYGCTPTELAQHAEELVGQPARAAEGRG